MVWIKKKLRDIGVPVVMIIVMATCCGFSLKARIVYKKVGDKTYVFDYAKKKVYNITYERGGDCATEGFHVDRNCKTIVSETFKKALTAARIEELKEEKLAVVFECDTDGKVESVRFLFVKEPFLTADEIERLEDTFLEQRFSIKVYSDDIRCIKFSMPCFFSRLCWDKR